MQDPPREKTAPIPAPSLEYQGCLPALCTVLKPERTQEVTKSETMPCNSWHCNATVLGSTVLCFIVKRVDMTRGPALQIGFSCPSYICMHIYLTDRVKQGCSTNNVVSDSFTYYWFSLNHRNSIVLRLSELAMNIKMLWNIFPF